MQRQNASELQQFVAGLSPDDFERLHAPPAHAATSTAGPSTSASGPREGPAAVPSPRHPQQAAQRGAAPEAVKLGRDV